MKCAAVGNILDYFIDDRLTPETETKVHYHLKKCPRCAEEAEKLADVKQKLSMLTAPALSAHLRTAICQNIAGQKSRPAEYPQFNWSIPPAYASAFCYIGAMLFLSLFSYGIPTQAYANGCQIQVKNQGGANG